MHTISGYEFQMMEPSDVGRSAETPRRSRSRSRRSLTRGRDRDSSRRSRSVCRQLQAREEALKQEQKRVRQLELELQRERDAEQRRQRSVRHGSPQEATRGGRSRSRSRRRSRGTSRHRSRGRSRGRSRSCSRSRSRGTSQYRGDSKRSRSPSFSSKDVTQIIKSIKDILSSQPGHSTEMSNRDRKNIISEFNPSEKNQRMDIWLKKVNECAMVYGWDERSTVHFAMQKLSGLAKTWYESQSTILYSWSEWQARLLSAFPCDQNYGQLLEDMLKRKSRINEPIQNYFYEKLSLLNQCDISGKRAVDCVIHGISDRTTRSSALALRCEEPDDLLKFLMSNNRDPYTPQQLYSKDRNSNTSDDKLNNRSSIKTNPGLFCYNCKEKGHPFSRCPKPLVKCSSCDKVGHKAELCRSKQETRSSKADGVAKTMLISSSKPNDKFTKEVIVEDMPNQAYIDLGSEVTLIAQSCLANLGLSHDHIPSTMKGFGNSLVSSLCSVNLNLSIDGVTATVCCRVVEDQFLEKDLLIGQTFTEQPHIVIYKDVNKLQFIHVDSELPNFIQDESDERLHKVSLVAHCSLQGAASVKVKTGTFTGNVIVDTKVVGKLGEQYIIYGGVYEVKDGSFYVTVQPCAVPCQLQENSIVARAERVDSVYRLVSGEIPTAMSICTESTSAIKFDESLVQLDETVSEETKAKLLDVLRRHKQCFAHGLADLGCTNAAEMNIELSSQRPVVYRPYRLSYHEREKVREMVDEMLEAGIIRESTSNYASPIILVRKKNGGMRLCVDYRLLNSLTIKERYPIPIIEDEVARLSGQAWFITLDLMSGYYQVPIAEESKHLTAFVTPDGHYKYNRMPFGLANAPAVFQRMMNHVLGQVRFNKATVYLDDLLIFGETPFEYTYITHLEEVLKLIENTQLKLNLSKCSFLRTKIDYLGYEIGADGMRPGSAKIQSVVDFPLPQNVHNVRQVLGLVSYFRKFIQSIAIPFHTLHVDHLGPFVKSKRGFTHTLNIVDSFTKFLFIKPVRSTSTQNVIKALQDIISRAPDRLISDRGSCFTAHAFRRFCLERGIKHVLNAVASPRANGQVERYNRTILDCLTAQNLRDNEKDWDSKIGQIQWGLNNTIQKTIGKTPAEIMFGTAMNSEVKPALNEIIEDTREVTDLSDIRTGVKEKIDKAQAMQKEQYDRNRHAARTYSKGDLVKITKVSFQGKGQSTKLMPSYEGPFRVTKVIGNDRYRVAPIAGFEGMKGKRKTTVAADRMRPWIHVASLCLDETDNGQSGTESIE